MPSRSQEDELLRRLRQGSCNALDRLVNAHLRFVVIIASRARTDELTLMDLIAEGTVGLIKGARDYDAIRHGSFTPHIVRRARREIQRAIARQRRRVRDDQAMTARQEAS